MKLVRAAREAFALGGRGQTATTSELSGEGCGRALLVEEAEFGVGRGAISSKISLSPALQAVRSVVTFWHGRVIVYHTPQHDDTLPHQAHIASLPRRPPSPTSTTKDQKLLGITTPTAVAAEA